MNYYAYIENNKIIITDNKNPDKKEISTNNILKNSEFESYVNIIYDNYKKIGANFSGDDNPTLFNLDRKDDILKLIKSNSEDQKKILNFFFFSRNKYIDEIGDIGDAQLKLKNVKLADCKKKTLYDVSTEYFTNLFFKNERINEIFQFITNVLFQVMIKKYIEENNLKQTDIIFIYKGGTTMKILFEKYKLIIPNLNEYFNNKNFKRSDSDYSIIINPNIVNPNKHRKEIIKLSFVILNELRKVFSTCKNVLFDNCELNDELVQDFIEKFNINLNNTECKDIFKNIKIVGLTYGDKLFFSECKYKDRFYNNDDIKNIKEKEIDTSINTDPPAMVIRKIGKILNRNYKSTRKDMYVENDKLFFMLDEFNYKSTKNSIYLSMNNNINQKHKTIEYNNFSLLRLKMNIILFYINTSDNTIGISNAPSELIDLSVPKIDSDELKFIYEHDVRNEIIKYKPTNTYLDFIYNGYSINGFIYDFIKQLYIASNPPWVGPKFEKRIQRFAFFILLSLLEIKNKNSEVSYKNLYMNLEKMILFFKIDYITISNNLNDSKILLEKIFKFFIMNKHISNIYLVKNYLLNLFDSNNNVYTPTEFISNDIKNYILKNPEEQLKYDTYRTEMIQNFEKIIIILKTLEANNTSIPFSSFVNIGVVNKYLKYKQKYLNLKKLL